METFLTVPGAAHSLSHVIITTQEPTPAATICISVTLTRVTVMTMATAMAIFNVELKIVIGQNRLIVAPTHLMKEVNSLDLIFRYSDNQIHCIYVTWWEIFMKQNNYKMHLIIDVVNSFKLID